MSANVASVMSYVNRVLLDLKPKRQRSKDIFSSLLVLFFRCCCFARFTVFMKEEKKRLYITKSCTIIMQRSTHTAKQSTVTGRWFVYSLSLTVCMRACASFISTNTSKRSPHTPSIHQTHCMYCTVRMSKSKTLVIRSLSLRALSWNLNI